MEFKEIVIAIVSAMGISAGGIWLVGKTWLSHLLDSRIAKKSIELEASVRHQVESSLGEEQARREYEYEARKRLHGAIGPLRFQLLIACRNAALRIKKHGELSESYSMNLSNYYGRSTAYRIIRPLAIAELIERQISYVDFSVEEEAIDILKFKRTAYAALNGREMIDDHASADWEFEIEHIFHDSLSRISNSLILCDNDISRVMHSHEFFERAADEAFVTSLDPLPRLLADFSFSETPLVWVRLVCYSSICASLIAQQGLKIGFEPVNINSDLLWNRTGSFLTSSQRATINERLGSSFKRGL